MTTFKVPRWARTLEVPPGVLDSPRAKALILDLERGGVEPTAARGFVNEILAAAYADIGESFAGATRALFADVARLRSQLRVKYDALRTHFEAHRGKPVSNLPPDLQPEAFSSLFAELTAKIDELTATTVESHVRKMPPSQLADDIDTTFEDVRRPVEDDPLLEPESRGRRERDERRGTGVIESERLERLYYSEALKGREPKEVRATLKQAARAFFLFPNSRWRLPPGWKVRVVKSPEYGARIAQQTAFADFDPLFAAHGYELHFTTDRGVRFQPDAVQLHPDGTIEFHEFKDPLREGSVETYRSSPDLQAELLQTLTDRAEAARSLPGCRGWRYDTSLPEMNRFIFDVLDSLPESSPLREFVYVADPDGRTL